MIPSKVNYDRVKRYNEDISFRKIVDVFCSIILLCPGITNKDFREALSCAFQRLEETRK